MKQLFRGTYKTARRIVVAIVGASVLVVGVALLVLPGPAFVVIPTGLAILAAEFAWARRWLKQVKEGSAKLWKTLTGNRAEPNAAAGVEVTPASSLDAPRPERQAPQTEGGKAQRRRAAGNPTTLP